MAGNPDIRHPEWSCRGGVALSASTTSSSMSAISRSRTSSDRDRVGPKQVAASAPWPDVPNLPKMRFYSANHDGK